MGGLLAIFVLALCGVVYAIEQSSALPTPARQWVSMICAGLAWIIVLPIVAWLAISFLLDVAAAGF